VAHGFDADDTTERGAEPVSDTPPPQHQPPEGTNPGWSPPPGGYPPHPSAYPPPYPYYGGPRANANRGTAGWIVGGCVALSIILLLGCAVSAVAFGRIVGLAIHRVANAQTVQASTSQQFAVAAAPTVVVDNTAGSVIVRAGAVDTVTVEATKSVVGASPTEAQRALDGISVSATQSGDTITVHTSLSGADSLFFPRTVALVLTVPPSSNLNVTLQAGDVELSDISGVIGVNAQLGDFNAQGLTLQDGSRLTVATGSVLLDGTLAPGATAAVTVQRGEATLTLPSATATHLAASTSIGGISITGWSVPVQQQGNGATASGDLGAGSTGSLSISVTTGNIVLAAR
jgi:hypothetical protein